MKKTLLTFISLCLLISCAVTHNKKDLVEFKTNQIPTNKLRIDGFTFILAGIDGLSNYYCAEGLNFENSFDNAHNNIQLMINAQKSVDKKIKKRCDFNPDDINRKGLTVISGNNIKIQYYQTEMQILNKDSFNSFYLYEMNGIIENDTSFVINEIKNYRTESITKVNFIYKFKKKKLKT